MKDRKAEIAQGAPRGGYCGSRLARNLCRQKSFVTKIAKKLQNALEMNKLQLFAFLPHPP